MAPGRGLLKVCGILFIIFGVFGILFGLYAWLLMPGMMSSPQATAMLQQAGTTYDEQTTTISGIISVVIGIIEIIVGIVGVKNCNRTDKAQICFIAGVVAVICQLGSALFSAFAAELTIGAILTMAIGFVLPVLFIWGALKNKEVSNQ